MTTAIRVEEATIWDALREVVDPELPTISVVDLGIVRSVAVDDGGVRVEIIPTFIGCPAINVICGDVRARLREFGEADVRVCYDEPWTSERITPYGRECLKAAGFAPPAHVREATGGVFPLTLHAVVPCPFCGAHNTRLENPFGPTLCRAIYYCPTCRQPFEHFKAV
jgi:ring-1,2-phenylacetyl-CoA epoxidase subunit PaaD